MPVARYEARTSQECQFQWCSDEVKASSHSTRRASQVIYTLPRNVQGVKVPRFTSTFDVGMSDRRHIKVTDNLAESQTEETSADTKVQHPSQATMRREGGWVVPSHALCVGNTRNMQGKLGLMNQLKSLQVKRSELYRCHQGVV